MHSLKLHTAIECNRLFDTTGTFWQDESYDHCILDEDELERIIYYVEMNPVKAGLVHGREQWQYSSAHDRQVRRIAFGKPFVRP